MYIISNDDFDFIRKVLKQYSDEGTLFDTIQVKNRRRKASLLERKMARKEPAKTISEEQI